MLKFNKSDFPPLPTMLQTHRSQRSGNEVADVRDRRTSTRAATIDDLPDELLLCILHYLPRIDLDYFNLPTLVSLSSTNRRFNRLVAEKVYAEFDRHFCEPYLFLRTVIRNAHLSGLLQYADFTHGKWLYTDRERYTASAQDKKIIKEGFRSLGVPDWKAWATACNTQDVDLDTLFSAILMWTPNIIRLRLYDGRIDFDSLAQSLQWIDVLKKGSQGARGPGIHRFEHLKILHVRFEAVTLLDRASCFRIPSLRELHLEDLTHYDSADNSEEQALRRVIPRHCNSLEGIFLLDSFVQPRTLEILLSSSTGLRVFDYRLDYNLLDEDMMEEPAENESIISALQHQKHSLESLTFRCEISEMRDRGAFPLDEGFKSFSALKTLSCPPGTLIDRRKSHPDILADKLPPAVTDLHFVICRDCDEQDMPVLEQLVHSYVAGAPESLEQIKFTVESPGPCFKYDWTRIVQPLSRTKIAVVIEEEDDEEFSESLSDEGGVEALSVASTSSEESDEVSLYSH